MWPRYWPIPLAAAATRRVLRLPPRASAAARALGTERVSKRLVIERSPGHAPRGPPVTSTWRDTEFATSRLRCTLLTTRPVGSTLSVAATPVVSGRTARVMSIVTVPGRRVSSTGSSSVGGDDAAGRAAGGRLVSSSSRLRIVVPPMPSVST